MGLIDPSTGRPFQESGNSDLVQLMNIVQMQEQRIQALSQQAIYLGIYMEYCFEQLEATTLADGSQITIEMSKFPAFAEQKFAELKQQHAAATQPVVNLDDA